MEFKGTKGKWFTTVLGEVYSENQVDNEIICEVIHGKLEDTKANALLISKAPEMLEMLQSLLNESEDIVHSEIKKDIEKLIKEATEI